MRVATFNLWYSSEYFEERTKATLEILEALHPDVICLQEVTPGFLEHILAEPWIRRHYTASHTKKSELGVMKYATVMLSKLKVLGYTSHDLPSFMDRKLIVGRFEIAGHVINVATAHLESEQQIQSRQQQMACLKEWLDEKGEAYVIAGDFNFGTSGVENGALAEYGWQDAWHELHGSEEGFTRDTRTNPLLRAQYPGGLQARFDRICSHSELEWSVALDPAQIIRLGTEAISPELSGVHPSDHYGLFCVMELMSHSEAALRRRKRESSCVVQ